MATGLERMKNQILDEAKAAAQQKIDEAQQQSETILEEARQEAEKEQETISRRAQTERATAEERIQSSTDMQRRTKILEAKQQLITEVIEEAYQSLQKMDDQQYFSMLEKLVENYALPEDGTMYLGPADQQRLPADFADRINQIAQQKGGSLCIATETKKIENGFILAYGGIEENCTLEAIFEAKQDDLSDLVQGILFAS